MASSLFGNAKRYDLLVHVLLVGDTGVGKTCLICRYAHNDFHESHITTIGVDFKLQKAEIQGRTVKMQIWDTAGQERFESITKQFYRRAQGVLLVFDICSRSSFESLAKWLLYVKQFSQPDTCVILLGNKCDREKQRQVPTAVAQKFADENDMRYFETSAKYPDNIEKPFHQICEDILLRHNYGNESEQSGSLNVSGSNDSIVDLNKPTSPVRQDSAETQMERGESDLTVQRGWCCNIL